MSDHFTPVNINNESTIPAPKIKEYPGLSLYSESIVHEEVGTTPHSRIGHLKAGLKRFRAEYRDYLAEFIGTMIFIMLLLGVTAAEILNTDPGRSTMASAMGSGLSLLMGFSISYHISGGHLNPAITLASAVYRGFPWRKVPGYVLCQILGAFVAAALLYVIIEPALNEFDGGTRQCTGEYNTANIFGSFPLYYIGIPSAIGSEIIGTAIFIILVFSICRQDNGVFVHGQAIFIPTAIVILALSLGFTSGFSLNPARDIGPRFFAAIAGWGWGIYSAHHYYFFVPMVAPLIGALLGGIVYTIFVD